MLVGVSDAAIVLFLEIIIRKSGLVLRRSQKTSINCSRSSFVSNCKKAARSSGRNDVDDVLIQPRFVVVVQFLQGLLHLLLLFFGELLILRNVDRRILLFIDSSLAGTLALRGSLILTLLCVYRES